MKQIELTIKLRNNLLKERREQLGLTTTQVAERIGVNYGLYIALETMKKSPLGAKGWRPATLKVAAFFGEPPEALWPDAILAIKKPEVKLKADVKDIAKLASPRRLDALPSPDAGPEDVFFGAEEKERLRRLVFQADLLSPADRMVLVQRYGLDGSEEKTLDEVGQKMGLSRERIRTLELRGLQRLREAAGRLAHRGGGEHGGLAVEVERLDHLADAEARPAYERAVRGLIETDPHVLIIKKIEFHYTERTEQRPAQWKFVPDLSVPGQLLMVRSNAEEIVLGSIRATAQIVPRGCGRLACACREYFIDGDSHHTMRQMLRGRLDTYMKNAGSFNG